MILRIGNQKIEKYNEISVTLQYDAIASTFGASFYFDPDNAADREAFRPATYKDLTLEHEGELLISGTLLGFSAEWAAEKSLIQLNGYSKTGVLGDCEIPTSAYPIQVDGVSLKDIAERVCRPFGLNVIVSDTVARECAAKYANVTGKNGQTAQQFLQELAAQKLVILSHDERGNLLLTRPAAGNAPIYHFEGGAPGVSLKLDFDGQRMHSGVTLIKQQTKGRKDGSNKKGNAGRATFNNPFVPTGLVRPRVSRQTNGKTIDTAGAARHLLSDELRGVQLTVTLDRWGINGTIVRPNQTIDVTAPELFIFNKTRWFISQVDFTGNESTQTAVLTCFLTSVFGDETPVNIFA